MKKTEDIYIYNNSFQSLLCLCKLLLEHHIKPFLIKNKEYVPNLFDHIIELELEKEEGIIDYFIKKIPKIAIKICYYVFLSEEENKELIIFYFLLNSFKYQEKIIYMRNLNCVVRALKIGKFVSREAHRMKGFIRFKELETKVFYAQMEPDNDILYLLSLHFQKRLASEYWMIRDKKRGMLSVYDKKRFYIIEDKNWDVSNMKLGKNELEMEELWKKFYNTIGIKERKNDRCRMNFMPKKYWKNILEMEWECEKDC